MLSLVEFVATVRGRSARDKILAVMYYVSLTAGKKGQTAEEIREQLRLARVPKSGSINISDVLAKAVPNVQPHMNSDGLLVWALTQRGADHVTKVLKIEPIATEVITEAGSLSQLLGRISDASVKEYIEESVMCLEVGALRASVVFLWSGAIRTLQQEALVRGSSVTNAAIARHDSRARQIGSVDDFAYIKDSVTLGACQTLGILDKNQKQILEQALDLRNKCGHPGKYSPGPKRVAAFIEDVTKIAFGVT